MLQTEQVRHIGDGRLRGNGFNQCHNSIVVMSFILSVRRLRMPRAMRAEGYSAHRLASRSASFGNAKLHILFQLINIISYNYYQITVIQYIPIHTPGSPHFAKPSLPTDAVRITPFPSKQTHQIVSRESRLFVEWDVAAGKNGVWGVFCSLAQ